MPVSPNYIQHRRFILTAQVTLAMALCLFGIVFTGNAIAQDKQSPDAQDKPSLDIVDRFEAKFEQSEDINFDQWPDGWKRIKGRGYPVYAKIQVEPELPDVPNSNLVLGMHLDGGNISLVSEPFKIDSRFSFHAHANIKTSEKSKHPCKAWYTVTFYDLEQQKIIEYKSKEISQSQQWNDISIGPIMPPQVEGVTAIVGLHLQPLHKTSLFGEAWFDNIWFARVPRIEITNDHHFAIFGYNDSVRMKCRVSGMREDNAMVTMTLLDEQKNVVSSHEVTLAEDSADKFDLVRQNNPNDYEIYWDMERMTSLPRNKRPGFYSLRLDLKEPGHQMIRETKNFAVVTDAKSGAVSDFGWSIKDDSAVEMPEAWLRLLTISNVGWLKMPVWNVLNNEPLATKVAEIGDQLARQGIALVGVLDQPPPGNSLLRFGDSADVAVMLRNEEAFKMAVSPVLARLTLHIRWWQLGDDNDHSLGDDNNSSEKAQAVMRHFSKYGQHLRVGVPWLWLQKPPDAGTETWDFVEFGDSVAMTASELQQYLEHRNQEGFQSWVTVQPIASDQYDLDTRVRDLIERTIAARRHRVPMIMMSPCQPKTGILHEDGSPTRMFVPWKVVTTALNQSNILGQLQLPGGSTNWVFERDGQVMMFVWNNKPTTETIYLGQDVYANSVWGRPVEIENDNGKQVLNVSRMPILISGMSPELAKLRLSFFVDKTKLKSIPGIEQPIRIRMQNPFEYGLLGTMSMNDEDYFDKNYYMQIKMLAGERIDQFIPIRLHIDAPTGNRLMRYDFRLKSGEHKEFSIWRPMQIGDDKAEFEVFADIDADGQLKIHAMLVNNSTSPISFDCSIYLPNRRKMKMDFFSALPGITKQNLVIPNADDLVGKTLIFRAREINGSRALNYRVEIKQVKPIE